MIYPGYQIRGLPVITHRKKIGKFFCTENIMRKKLKWSKSRFLSFKSTQNRLGYFVKPRFEFDISRIVCSVRDMLIIGKNVRRWYQSRCAVWPMFKIKQNKQLRITRRLRVIFAGLPVRDIVQHGPYIVSYCLHISGPKGVWEFK